MYVCSNIFPYTLVQKCTHMCVHLCGSPGVMLSVFPQLFSIYLLWQTLIKSGAHQFSQSSQSVWPQTPISSVSQGWGPKGFFSYLRASTLATEPSPQHLFQIFLALHLLHIPIPALFLALFGGTTEASMPWASLVLLTPSLLGSTGHTEEG